MTIEERIQEFLDRQSLDEVLNPKRIRLDRTTAGRERRREAKIWRKQNKFKLKKRRRELKRKQRSQAYQNKKANMASRGLTPTGRRKTVRIQ